MQNSRSDESKEAEHTPLHRLRLILHDREK